MQFTVWNDSLSEQNSLERASQAKGEVIHMYIIKCMASQMLNRSRKETLTVLHTYMLMFYHLRTGCCIRKLNYCQCITILRIQLTLFEYQ